MTAEWLAEIRAKQRQGTPLNPTDTRGLLAHVDELQCKIDQMNREGILPIPLAQAAGSVSGWGWKTWERIP